MSTTQSPNLNSIISTDAENLWSTVSNEPLMLCLVVNAPLLLVMVMLAKVALNLFKGSVAELLLLKLIQSTLCKLPWK